MKEGRLRPVAVLLAFGLAVTGPSAFAATVSVDLQSSGTNQTSPQMGDNLTFHSTIRNDGASTANGVIAWISLVQIDQGNEQPVDLEDWNAHKAVSAARLGPGQTIETDWPMRLIQAGTYRVVISVVTRDGAGLAASPFIDFSIREKAVVESARVLPVALGVPLLLGGLLAWRQTRWQAAG